MQKFTEAQNLLTFINVKKEVLFYAAAVLLCCCCVNFTLFLSQPLSSALVHRGLASCKPASPVTNNKENVVINNYFRYFMCYIRLKDLLTKVNTETSEMGLKLVTSGYYTASAITSSKKFYMDGELNQPKVLQILVL